MSTLVDVPSFVPASSAVCTKDVALRIRLDRTTTRPTTMRGRWNPNGGMSSGTA
jgi:hypothetical protein